jgi:periplasmic protein TonB
MKRGQIKTGVLSMAGGMLVTLFMSACNDTNQSSTSSNAEGAAKDTTTVAAAPVKKKGKASMGTATADNAAKVEKDKEGVYTKAEVMPMYPGSSDGLSSYINTNLVYPQDAIDNNVEGTVNVQFVVDEKGNVSDVKTIGNKLGYGLEEEAVTVVNKLPKWEPGKVKGKSVKTRLTIPITYKLEG